MALKQGQTGGMLLAALFTTYVAMAMKKNIMQSHASTGVIYALLLGCLMLLGLVCRRSETKILFAGLGFAYGGSCAIGWAILAQLLDNTF